MSVSHIVEDAVVGAVADRVGGSGREVAVVAIDEEVEMHAAFPNDGDYEDRWISCTPTAIEIRGYSFPRGTKRIGYDAVRSVRRVRMGVRTGWARIWGTANPRYWAHLDPQRPRKTTALILDLGHSVGPFITPDDPDVAAAIICARANIAPTQASRRGPVI